MSERIDPHLPKLTPEIAAGR